MPNDDITEIARQNREGWAGKKIWVIVEDEDGFTVHQHSPDGVAPTSTYPSAGKAMSRLLQLLHIGPVAPQTHPETACIGEVTSD